MFAVILFWNSDFMPKISSKPRGILYVLTAAFGFSVMSLFVKLAGDLPPFQKAFFRNFIALIFILVIMLKNKVGFIPQEYNMLATMLVSFTCAMQVQTFRKVNGYGYASTMCIGNLRSGTESLSVFFREREHSALRKALHYYGIIFIFAIGAGLGGVLSLRIGVQAIWGSCILLVIVCAMMIREHR